MIAINTGNMEILNLLTSNPKTDINTMIIQINIYFNNVVDEDGYILILII